MDERCVSISLERKEGAEGIGFSATSLLLAFFGKVLLSRTLRLRLEEVSVILMLSCLSICLFFHFSCKCAHSAL